MCDNGPLKAKHSLIYSYSLWNNLLIRWAYNATWAYTTYNTVLSTCLFSSGYKPINCFCRCYNPKTFIEKKLYTCSLAHTYTKLVCAA